MGKVRTFYGHQGVLPLGTAPHAVVVPESDEGTEAKLYIDDVELPGSRATVAELDTFGEVYGLEFNEGATAKDKRAAIAAWADELPQRPEEAADESEDAAGDDDTDAEDDEAEGADEAPEGDESEADTEE